MSREQLDKNPAYQALLVEYAAGTLNFGHTMIVSAHLTYAPAARDIVRSCENIGGLLMEKYCTPVAMAENSLQNVLNQIDHPLAQKQKAAPQARKSKSIYPEDLCSMPECLEHHLCPETTNQLKWKKMLPGINGFEVPTPCHESTVSIFRLKPDVCTPDHKHTGLEVTLVLDGALSDEGIHFQQGDLIVHDPGEDEHAPKSCKNHGCVCIMSFDGPVRFTHFPMNLLNFLMK